MARRTFDVIDVVEVLQHWHAGRPKLVIAESLGLDVKTVRRYVAPAEAAGMVPGGPALDRAGWAELVRDWFPSLVDPRARSLTHPVIAPHRALIATMIKTNTVTTVHQRLRDEHGLAVSLTSLRRYVWAEFPEDVARDRVRVPRPPGEPGEEAQVDYGYLGRWMDPRLGRMRRVWAFVMILAWSRHMFVRPVLSMDARSWSAAHVAAFTFLGGVPARLVIDNLGTGVTRADLYDPRINRAYAELAAHFGTLIDPARARKPRDKPRVERPMPYVRDSFWAGREWTSELQMQEAALRWCLEVAGVRAHRSLDGASPLSLFEAEEAATLRPLPSVPFELATWSTPKVGPDCHVKVGKALYSVPWRHIGREVDAREGERTVEVFVDGQVVKTWGRIAKGMMTDHADFPPEKVAFLMRTPVWCRHRAAELGPSVAALVEALLERPVLARLRSAQGVIRLADRHDAARLDAACARALLVGDPAYRTVKGILAAGTEHEGASPTAMVDVPAHLRGSRGLFEGLDGEHPGDDGKEAAG